MSDRAPRGGATTIRALRTIAEVEEIAEAWESLLARSECNRAFSSAAWYRAACECYGGITPHVLVAERDGEIVAILPLVIDAATGEARFATRLGDYNDIIAPAGERVACELLLGRHRDHAGAYGRLLLNFLRSDSNCIAGLRALHGDDAVDGSFDARRVCPYIDLGIDGGDYLMRRSRVSRKDLYRRRRAAERAGAAARVHGPETLAPAELPGIFLALHEERFGGASPLVTGEHRAFVERVLPPLFASRKTVAVTLELDGEIVAIDLLHAGSRSLCSWNGGFAASAAWLSPGALVIDAGIALAVERGCREYDMLRGTEPYKLSLCDSRRELARWEKEGVEF